MIINPLRWILTRSAVVLILPLLLAGCFYNLGEHKNFSSWYYGDPGMAGALGEAQCDRYADRIQGERHHTYLHFRTPEVFLQPQGGAHYPARLTAQGREGGSDSDVQGCEKVAKGWETFHFDTVDAGLVDTVIPYRQDTAVNDRERGFGQASLDYAEGLAYNTGLTVVMKAPIYIVHDILKTLYIPVASTYYLLKPDAPPEAPSESIQVQETTLTEKNTPAAAASVLYAANASVLFVDATESPADTAEEIVANPSGSPPLVGPDDDTVAPAPAQPEKTAVDPFASAGYGERPAPGDHTADAADAYTVMENELSAEASDNAAAASTEAVRAEKDKPAWPPMDEVLGIPIPPASERPAGVAPEPAAVAAPEDDVAEREPVGETPQEERDVPAVEGESPAEFQPEGAADGEPETADASALDEGVDAAPIDLQKPSGTMAEGTPAPSIGTEAEKTGTVADDRAEPSAVSATAIAEGTRTAAGENLEKEGEEPADDAEAFQPAEGEPLVDDTAPSAGEEPQTAAAPADDPAAELSSVAAETPPIPPGAPEPFQKDAGGYPAAVSTEAEQADAGQLDVAEAPAAVVDQTDEVAAAAAALSAIARMGGGPESAATQTDRKDATSTGTEADDAVSSAPDGPSAEIAEEDLLAADVTTDGRSAAEALAGDFEHPDEPDPSASNEASVPLANVAPAQQAVTLEAPSTLKPIERVRIKKSKLKKKAAFIGFFSRSAGVDESTKTYLQDHLWPVFHEQCDDLTLLRRGDAGYPAALDSLVRDQFGRLNSFELTTVARFSGLNAIVAATIIDIRVATEISGILWYKSPESKLRLTILVEVFDAETGTKLLDRTYIREEEVEELEPGASEALRPEDRPVLEAALRSVAEDMGEHVCETLDDLPWRAYVSGINRERVALSAGESAGLAPGNILKVYNSQIIDGLNNQQFFLTGERVGRIQIVEVFPDRSEALLIEGQGLRDYSVAIP